MSCPTMKKKLLLIFAGLLSILPVKSQSVWYGTGFAIGSRYVVTNYHVVEDANSITVSVIKNNINRAYYAEVVATDKVNDIAVVKITDSDFKGFSAIPYGVTTRVADVGEDVFVLGFPLTQTLGDEIKLTTGVINSRTGMIGWENCYQIQAPITNGNSGGPMFDNKGNVVGIVVGKLKQELNLAENVGYAIKTAYLKIMIDNAGLNIPFPNNNTISNLSRPEKVKRIRNFVCYIECSDRNVAKQQPTQPQQQPKDTPTPPQKFVPDGYVDLGLPSGTLWSKINEEGYFTYDEAVKQFGNNLPTKGQFKELIEKCKWKWKGNGYAVTGPNGNSFFLPAAGYRYGRGVNFVGTYGYYWSSTYVDERYAWNVNFDVGNLDVNNYYRDYEQSVRLVQSIGTHPQTIPTQPKENQTTPNTPETTPAHPQTKSDSQQKVTPEGYVDLGLPSGTLWKDKNESGKYTYDEAIKQFGEKIPNWGMWVELKDKCKWDWEDNGYIVTGPNGNSIFLPAAGDQINKVTYNAGTYGHYWSRTHTYEDLAWGIVFCNEYIKEINANRFLGKSIRLVKK